MNEITNLSAQARAYIQNSKSANTIRAYKSDWRQFENWCRNHERESLPASPETTALYATAMAAGSAMSTITRRLASITQAHITAGHEPPTRSAIVRSVMQGIRREKGIAVRQKAPVFTTEIRAMIGAMNPAKLGSIRTRSLLLVGFAGALRRSELVALNVNDLEFATDGLIVTIRRSKGDQDGAGVRVGIPYGSDPLTCPVRTTRSWLDASGISSGPVFRAVNRHGKVSEKRLSDKTVAEIVKCAAELIGKDPANYSGHSLRAGLATAAAEAGVDERAIMSQGRWRSLVVRRYIRHGSLFTDNAAARVGL
ncbi:site-specific integrase [Capsulimonas corticalis]|uniref:site-specific integrase n=1 Tax=Capsulimonas corticalis TaxID=2219043 RepID=UPI000E6507A2|nr:site-specific integrase [Capsulimonas corticalis]